jgi:hypothetical protein
MAAKPTKTKIEDKRPLFNVRISGQIRAGSFENAAKMVGEAVTKLKPGGPEKCAKCSSKLAGGETFCPKCGSGILPDSGPLLEGGILRITQAEGA